MKLYEIQPLLQDVGQPSGCIVLNRKTGRFIIPVLENIRDWKHRKPIVK